MHVISNKAIDGDNEVLWRHGMLSDIVYAYTNKGAMPNRSQMTLLLINEPLSNRRK